MFPTACAPLGRCFPPPGLCLSLPSSGMPSKTCSTGPLLAAAEECPGSSRGGLAPQPPGGSGHSSCPPLGCLLCHRLSELRGVPCSAKARPTWICRSSPERAGFLCGGISRQSLREARPTGSSGRAFLPTPPLCGWRRRRKGRALCRSKMLHRPRQQSQESIFSGCLPLSRFSHQQGQKSPSPRAQVSPAEGLFSGGFESLAATTSYTSAATQAAHCPPHMHPMLR